MGSVLHLLLDAGFLFLLRFSLDDRVDGVIAAAVQALRALLVAPGDEELLDSTFSWYHGVLVFPLMPSQKDKEDEDEDEERLTEKTKRKSPEEGNRPPSDLARYDVIKVKMLGQLHVSHDLKGKHLLGKKGHQSLAAFGSGFISLIPRGFWPPTCFLGCATFWR